jgi:hypothetical protein
MNSTLVTKVLAGTVGLACIMTLSLAGKIDGPTAASAIQTITGVFLGGAAVLGGAQAVANAMKKTP